MSIIGSNILAGAAGSGVSAYEIEQSLRFNSGDSPYLVKTFSSSPTSTTTQTFSWWVKLVNADGSNQFPGLYGRDGTSEAGFSYRNTGDSVNPLGFRVETGTARITTSAKYRDYSAWHHIVMVYDTDNGTSTDRMRLYVNGERIDAFAGASYPSSGANTRLLSTNSNGNLIGSYATNSNFSDFYLAEFHGVDGQALTHEDFGEFDDNGVWRPIEYTGSHGTNGFYLKFDPSATNGIGHDHSGNGNDFTPTGFDTTNTTASTYDVMSDTPTTNWCTLNPGYKAVSGATISEGNLKVAYPSAPPTGMHVGTLATTNAFYVEAKATAATSNQIYLGVETPDRGNINNNYPGGGPDGWGYGMNGNIYNNGSTVSSTGTTYTTNDLIGIACDPSSGTIEFFKNGTSVYSGTSVANVPLTICVSQSGGSGNSGTIEINCGQRAYEQTPPTGFSALNTANLPAPDIADGSQYFDTAIWSGNNASSRDIPLSNSSIVPDFVWVKPRGPNNANHVLFDAVRGFGSGKGLSSDTTGIEGGSADATYGYVSGTGAGEFTVNYATSGNLVNLTGQTYVGWAWDAGGSGSSNTDGSITSTVSANPTAGFSIVSYTGTGANATVGHGLGVAPTFLAIKNRDTNSSWMNGHQGLGSWSDVIFFDLTSAKVTDSTVFNGTAPTSTVFSVGTNAQSNNLNDDMIAYCFAEVEGYSKFGSFVGNGSSDGPFVYCGFRPAWIMLKIATGVESWQLVDTARRTYNPMTNYMSANTANAEASAVDFWDQLSNGFKLRNGGGYVNGSGNTYIFAAFAENPFGGSGVSPATAR